MCLQCRYLLQNILCDSNELITKAQTRTLHYLNMFKKRRLHNNNLSICCYLRVMNSLMSIFNVFAIYMLALV